MNNEKLDAKEKTGESEIITSVRSKRSLGDEQLFSEYENLFDDYYSFLRFVEDKKYPSQALAVSGADIDPDDAEAADSWKNRWAAETVDNIFVKVLSDVSPELGEQAGKDKGLLRSPGFYWEIIDVFAEGDIVCASYKPDANSLELYNGYRFSDIYQGLGCKVIYDFVEKNHGRDNIRAGKDCEVLLKHMGVSGAGWGRLDNEAKAEKICGIAGFLVKDRQNCPEDLSDALNGILPYRDLCDNPEKIDKAINEKADGLGENEKAAFSDAVKGFRGQFDFTYGCLTDDFDLLPVRDAVDAVAGMCAWSALAMDPGHPSRYLESFHVSFRDATRYTDGTSMDMASRFDKYMSVYLDALDKQAGLGKVPGNENFRAEAGIGYVTASQDGRSVKAESIAEALEAFGVGAKAIDKVSRLIEADGKDRFGRDYVVNFRGRRITLKLHDGGKRNRQKTRGKEDKQLG